MRYAVYNATHGWLVDTCAGGRFDWDVDEAIWFESHEDAMNSLIESEILGRLDALPDYLKILRVK